MGSLGIYILILGFGITVLAQLVGAALVFRASIVRGMLSLVIPGYIFFALKRRGLYKAVVGVWSLGLLVVVVGGVLVS
jgi:hypothetical protein